MQVTTERLENCQVNVIIEMDAAETEKKLRYDFYYVKHCSFGLDVTIAWRTILTILTGFGSR